MVRFNDKIYEFEEIEQKVLAGEIEEDKEFIIEALRSCFFTEDGMTTIWRLIPEALSGRMCWTP